MIGSSRDWTVDSPLYASSTPVPMGVLVDSTVHDSRDGQYVVGSNPAICACVTRSERDITHVRLWLTFNKVENVEMLLFIHRSLFIC